MEPHKVLTLEVGKISA